MVTNIRNWGWAIVSLIGWGFQWGGQVNIYVAYALWGIAAIWLLFLLVTGIRKRGVIMSKDKDDKQANIIKDTKIKAKIEKADKATALDVNAPTVVEGVEVSLEAKEVKDAAAVRTNQPLNLIMSTCAQCHKPLPGVSFGVRLSTITCRFCGHVNKVGGDE